MSPNSAQCAKYVLNQNSKKMTFLEQMILQLAQSRDSLIHQEQMERKKDHKQKLHLSGLAKKQSSNSGFEFKYLNHTVNKKCGRTSGKPELGGTEAPHWLARSN